MFDDETFDDKYVLKGVLDDPRSHDDKKLDFGAEELDFGTTEYASYKYQPTTRSMSQAHVYDCVPSSHNFAQELINRPEGSRLYLYRKRSNFPDQGMYPQECASLFNKVGTPPYEMLPNTLYEDEANQIVLTPEMDVEADRLKSSSYLSFKSNQINIDNFAALCQYRPIVICAYASLNEWSQLWVTREDTKVTLDNAKVRHSITIYPKSSFIMDGKKWITVGDSAYFGGFYYRYLDEEFIKERIYNALYYTDFSYLPESKEEYKLKHTFGQTVLSYGMYSKEVAWLQKCLQWLKLFPIGSSSYVFFVTGHFYGLTLKAVKDFQMMYKDDILVPAGLKEPTGVVGKYTIKKLNELFS